MNEYDWDNPNIQVDLWLIGYYKDKQWETLRIPGDLSEELVERIIEELNQKYHVIYKKQKEGILQKDPHKTRKGEFLGL